jgi:predicted Zn-dependent peptidase
VVIEEINMSEDDPDDVAHENFTSTVFAGHNLENPVLGTRDSIRGMTRDDIVGYWKTALRSRVDGGGRRRIGRAR